MGYTGYRVAKNPRWGEWLPDVYRSTPSERASLLAQQSDVEVIGEARWQRCHPGSQICPTGPGIDGYLDAFLNSISVTLMLKEEMPDLAVVMLTMFDLEAYRMAAKESGADGNVLEQSLLDDLIPMIRTLKGQER